MAVARSMFGICELSGLVYVTGGFPSSGMTAGLERYDPQLDVWSAMPPMPGVRFGHGSCVRAVGDAVYVLGGLSGGQVSASVLKYDVAGGEWSDVSRMPEPRRVFGSCVVGRDIYVVGGTNSAVEATSSLYW